MPDFSLESEAKAKGFQFVCGVDEAGRGPLAGPVCAAAVVFSDDVQIEGINDSKKLSEKKREALYDTIREKALAFGIAFATVEEIEEFNILNATYIAMNRAIEQLGDKVDFALIDGNRIPKDIKVECETVVKGDAKSMSIAAASILAKVSRDRYMEKLHEQYPQYRLDKHKGYPTKLHYELLAEYGIQDFYRKSFLKNRPELLK